MLSSYSVLSKQTQIWSHTSPQRGSLIMRCGIFFFLTVLLLMPELSWGYKTKEDKAHQFVRREKSTEASPVPLIWNPAVDVLLSTFPASSKFTLCHSHFCCSPCWLLALTFPWTKLNILETSSNLCLPQLHRQFVISTYTYTLLKIRSMKYTSFFFVSEMVISVLSVSAPQNYAVHLIPCVGHTLKRGCFYCFHLGKDAELQEMLNIDSCFQSKLFWNNWF